MSLILADTFTESLQKLPAKLQDAAKKTVMDLTLDPDLPSLKPHRVDRSPDPNFWSVSVNDDVRIITHRNGAGVLLCYVDHHDAAYAWAERRKITEHPETGAIQMVNLRERDETVSNRPDPAHDELNPPLFRRVKDKDLLRYGVPVLWLDAVKQVRDEDSLMELAVQLPEEAAEALIELATGGTPLPSSKRKAGATGFEHPDARRRFTLICDEADLIQALDYPWEKWTVFLHPSQRQLVENKFKGPVRVFGSAGTGKTVVALHRAVHLAKLDPASKLLVTSANRRVAGLLRLKLSRLVSPRSGVGKQIEIKSIDEVAIDAGGCGPDVNLAGREEVRAAIREAAKQLKEDGFSHSFLFQEWETIVDAFQIESFKDYRKFRRTGRKTGLSQDQRRQIWLIFEQVRACLRRGGLLTWAQVYRDVTARVAAQGPRYDHIIVDEAQDISVAQLRFVKALGSDRKDALYFVGDLGQRIATLPFSWQREGIKIRGRAHTLKVNYRTTRQIMQRAVRLVPEDLTDPDGHRGNPEETISILSGPSPMVRLFESPGDETDFLAGLVSELVGEKFTPGQIGVFVREESLFSRAGDALDRAGVKWETESAIPGTEAISLMVMDSSKGFEFRAVILVGCDEGVIPPREWAEDARTREEMEELLTAERQRLYVAVTRAREFLCLTGLSPGSGLLAELSAAGRD